MKHRLNTDFQGLPSFRVQSVFHPWLIDILRLGLFFLFSLRLVGLRFGFGNGIGLWIGFRFRLLFGLTLAVARFIVIRVLAGRFLVAVRFVGFRKIQRFVV